MEYGNGGVVLGTGVVMLPATGDNMVLMIVAASLIALGGAVLVVSLLLSRKKRQADVQ